MLLFLSFAGSGLFFALCRAHEALSAVADQILAPGRYERFAHEPGVFGVGILQKRSLHRLFVRIRRDVHVLHRDGIDARVVHAGADRAGRGVKILHLLGAGVVRFQIQRERHRILHPAARVRGHQIRHNELRLAVARVERVVFFEKPLVHRRRRLTHVAKHRIDAVLRRHLALAGDVVLHELRKKRAVLVAEDIVEPHAGAHEHLLDARDGAQLPQQREIVPVVGHEIFTRRRRKAVLQGTHAVFELLFAARCAEVRRRAADIGDIALPERVVRHGLHLADDGFVAARCDHPPLMERERAEVAPAEASAVVDDTEAHLLDGRNAAERLIHRVRLARIGKRRHGVELLRFERHSRRVNDKEFIPVRLGKRPAPDGVVLGILRARGERVLLLILAHLLKRRQDHRALRRFVGDDCRAADAAQRFSVAQAVCGLERCALTHAVDENVGTRIENDAAAHLIVPVIVMRKPAERGLHPAEQDRDAGERLPRTVGVNSAGAVGPQPGLSSRRVKILAATLFRRRIVRHHAVQIACADENAELRPPHRFKRRGVVPRGLREHRHAVARVLEQPPDDGRAERRVIHVGVARHEQYIIPVPAAREHIRARYGQKILRIRFTYPPGHP